MNGGAPLYSVLDTNSSAPAPFPAGTTSPNMATLIVDIPCPAGGYPNYSVAVLFVLLAGADQPVDGDENLAIHKIGRAFELRHNDVFDVLEYIRAFFLNVHVYFVPVSGWGLPGGLACSLRYITSGLSRVHGA